MLWTRYHRAANLTDALQALAGCPGQACVVAGGTDLLLDMQQGRHEPVHTLVDVTSVPEMGMLEVRQGLLFIGAGAPLNHIVQSPLVRQHAQALVEACDLIGGPQVRNIATLGGNVAHALPAADGTIALLAFDAQAEIASQAGLRRAPLLELFRGPGKSALDAPREILVGFYLPLSGPGQASAFKRVMRPQGVALPILNMACWLARQGEQVTAARLSIGPAGPTPRRLFGVEALLAGRPLDAAALESARQAVGGEVSFRTSPHRATAAYRQHLVGSLMEDVLRLAWERAARA